MNKLHMKFRIQKAILKSFKMYPRYLVDDLLYYQQIKATTKILRKTCLWTISLHSLPHFSNDYLYCDVQ